MEKIEKKLKIIFVGIPDMALICLNKLLEAGFEIIGIIPPKKTHETFNFFKSFVETKGLNFLEFENSPNDSEYCKKIARLGADIGVVCSYNTRFSKEFLSTTKMGYINCHPSLLPYYRGAAPYFHIINNGETTSGITLHFMDETFDTGDIIYQERFEVLPIETMGTIFNRTSYMLADALVKVLSELQEKGKIKRTPQDKSHPFVDAPKVGGSFAIRWKIMKLDEIERLIRACNPFYNALTTFRGVSTQIVKASAIKKDHNYEFGRIVRADQSELIVAAKGGYLKIDTLKIGTWGYFNPSDFYNLFTPTTEELFV